MIKNLAGNAGDIRDVGSIPGWGRSPGEGNGNPLQYSCLEIPWTEESGGLQSMRSQRIGHDIMAKRTVVVLFFPHRRFTENSRYIDSWSLKKTIK